MSVITALLPPRWTEFLRRSFRSCLFAPLSVGAQAKVTGWMARWFGRPAPAAAGRTDRIVVVKLDRIGDFVMVTPFLRELRRNHPFAWIALVVSSKVEMLATGCPYVDEVIITPPPSPGLRGSWRQWLAWHELAWRRLLPLRPTLALLPRWDVDLYEAYALLALSGARRRVSYSAKITQPKARLNRGADLLLTDAVSRSPGHHEVERNLGLLQALHLRVEATHEEIWLSIDAQTLVQRLLPAQEHHRLVALCPFSAEEIKNWPLSRFLEVVRHFADRPGVTFVLLADLGYAEISTCPKVRQLSNLVSLAGRLSLAETAALISRCDLVVSVDTGIMHIAGALRRPLVLISGLSTDQETESHYSPTRFGPWRSDYTLVAPRTSVAGPRGIDAVSVDQVVAAVESRLSAA